MKTFAVILEGVGIFGLQVLLSFIYVGSIALISFGMFYLLGCK